MVDSSNGPAAPENLRPEITEELDRSLGFSGTLALSMGTMLAAAIFVLSGLAVSEIGAGALVAILAAAVVAALSALAYAEFAALYPESGGGYAYVDNTFATDSTFLVGWMMILAYPAGAAFYLASSSAWFYQFVYPVFQISSAVPYWTFGLVCLVILAGVNLMGTRESSSVLIGVTVLQLIIVGVFVYGGISGVGEGLSGWMVSGSPWDSRELGITSVLVFVAFLGFEIVATNGEEISSPERVIPRVILVSIGVVTVLFLLTAVITTTAIQDAEFLQYTASILGLQGMAEARQFLADNGEYTVGLVARYFLGEWGYYLTVSVGLLSLVSAANATIMAGSRVKLAMARRNHLPRFVEAIHPRFGTPHRGVLITCGLVLVFLLGFIVLFGESAISIPLTPDVSLSLGLQALAQFADIMLLCCLVFVNLALIQSRQKSPNIERAFRVPFVPVFPALAIAGSILFLITVDTQVQLLGLAGILLGVVFWFFWKTQPSPPERLEERAPTAVAEYRSPGHSYTLLIAVAGSQHVDRMLRLGGDLAMDRQGEVLIMNAVTIPDQTPLAEGRQLAQEKRHVLEHALASASRLEIPANGIIRVAHRSSDAILNTIRQHTPDAVLLGWEGGAHANQNVVLGTTLDRILREATCDVIVERFGNDGLDELNSILLPTAGGAHAGFSIEVAGALARRRNARVVAVHVVSPRAEPDKFHEARLLLDRVVGRLPDVEVETRILKSDDVVEALVDEIPSHDLTILGASNERTLSQYLLGQIPESVAEQTSEPLLVVKRNVNVASQVGQLLQSGN